MLLLALYLGFWLYLVGLAFLLVLVVQWLRSRISRPTQIVLVYQPVQQGTRFRAVDTALIGLSPKLIATQEEDLPKQLPKAS